MKKRIMSLMLSLCMVCALLPAAVAPAAAISGKDLDAAKEVIEKNITEIALSNETTEEYLARTLTAMLPEGNQTRILIEFASHTPATTEKTGSITCKWFLYDGTKVGMDYLSSGMTFLTIPVAKPNADDAAMLAADKAAITAAFAEYFATANINEGNILAQKRNLQAIIDDEVQYCSEAKFLKGGSGFSTDVKKGFIRGAFSLRLGGEYEEVALDVTIHADGSATMNSPTPPASETTPTTPTTPAGGTAYPSTQTVDLDGKKVEFQMYALKDANGNPTNYVKVRDVALALNGTKAQFAVGWDGAVNLESGKAYTSNGTENKTPFSGERSYTLPTSATKVNGADSDLQAIVLTDDAGGGYTYYQLRDLGSKLGFNVGWSAEKGIFIESDKPYSGN